MTNPTKEPNHHTVPEEIGSSGCAFRIIFFGLSKTENSIKTSKKQSPIHQSRRY